MPYLDSKIQIDKHKRSCSNPVGKRLYIRDYDDEGKQKFVSWGLTCTTCGVVVKEKYERGLTPKEQRYIARRRESEVKGSKSEYNELMQKIGRHSITPDESLELRRRRKLGQKLERLQRTKLGPERMSPKEAGLRKRIGRLKQFYELMSLHWGDLRIAWDDKLVEQFLNIVPRPTIKELAEVFQPSWSKVNVDSQKWRRYKGYIDDPDKQGWLKYDKEKYKKLLESEALKRQEMMREIIESRGQEKK